MTDSQRYEVLHSVKLLRSTNEQNVQ